MAIYGGLCGMPACGQASRGMSCVVSATRRSSGVAPRACVRAYARVLKLVPPNLYIHTYCTRHPPTVKRCSVLHAAMQKSTQLTLTSAPHARLSHTPRLNTHVDFTGAQSETTSLYVDTHATTLAHATGAHTGLRVHPIS